MKITPSLLEQLVKTAYSEAYFDCTADRKDSYDSSMIKIAVDKLIKEVKG